MNGRIYLHAAIVAALSFPASGAHAQTYPVKPVRIVASEAGGGLDFVARVLGQTLTSNLGQQVIIDNRPSGVFTDSIVSKASPDGYTATAALHTSPGNT